MKNLRKNTEYTAHENELASDPNLDKICRCLYINHKLLQPNQIEYNNIYALKTEESNERNIQDGSPNLHNHYNY